MQDQDGEVVLMGLEGEEGEGRVNQGPVRVDRGQCTEKKKLASSNQACL